jgi:hypothetical protein
MPGEGALRRLRAASLVAATPEGVSGPLYVFVSNPRLVPDLQFFLRRVGCAAIQVNLQELEVEVPGAPSEDQARREVELYLALWRGRKTDVNAFVVGSGSSGEVDDEGPG